MVTCFLAYNVIHRFTSFTHLDKCIFRLKDIALVTTVFDEYHSFSFLSSRWARLIRNGTCIFSLFTTVYPLTNTSLYYIQVFSHSIFLLFFSSNTYVPTRKERKSEIHSIFLISFI